MTSERQLRDTLVRFSHAVYSKGWVANHDGNLTVRLSSNRFLATPTSVSKGDVSGSWLIVVDTDGKRVAGDRNPFSELALHLAAYDVRPDVQAVIHAHSPYATAFAVAGRGLDRPIIAEAVISLGARVPLASFALPGTLEYTGPVRDLLLSYDAILLENHGVLSVGDSLEQAFLRMELVEHLARIETTAAQIGPVQYLDRKTVDAMLQKRAKAGLGPRARGLSEPGPVTHGVAEEQLRQIVAEEVRRLVSGVSE
jgi:L-fuculose-phosphate aldolase